jgi:mannose-1-phosphate guanylyltransferase
LISGDDRPKQFCRILGGNSLLRDTLSRLALNVEPDSTLCVVLREHQRFYQQDLQAFAPLQIVAQPSSRGTAAAVAYALRRVAALAGRPTVVGFFPSDHHYANGLALQRTVSLAYNAARAHPDRVFLVGAEATEPEVDYGWIEPGGPLMDATRPAPKRLPARTVSRFWEKPSPEVARALLARGCLWNTFIVIGSDEAFVRLFKRTQPQFWSAFEAVSGSDEPALEAATVRAVYDRIPAVDLSREVLERAGDVLGVIPMPNAGWTDLGRPARVLDVLTRNRLPHPRLRLAAS